MKARPPSKSPRYHCRKPSCAYQQNMRQHCRHRLNSQWRTRMCKELLRLNLKEHIEQYQRHLRRCSRSRFIGSQSIGTLHDDPKCPGGMHVCYEPASVIAIKLLASYMSIVVLSHRGGCPSLNALYLRAMVNPAPRDRSTCCFRRPNHCSLI